MRRGRWNGRGQRDGRAAFAAQRDGHAVSDTVPTKAWIAVDRRALPGETDVSALEPIRQVVSSIVAPPFTAEIEISGFVPPYLAAEDDPLIAVTRQAALEADRPGNLSADLATDDSTWLGNAGISTILCGPGEPEQAHTVDERIDVADIRDATGIFAGLCRAARHGDTGTG